jgi:hypothetical protein
MRVFIDPARKYSPGISCLRAGASLSRIGLAPYLWMRLIKLSNIPQAGNPQTEKSELD